MSVRTDTAGRPEVSLPSDPAELPAIFARAFNAGDLAAVDLLFEPDAVRVLTPGIVVTGDGRRGATSGFFELGIPMVLTLRHAYVCGDLALLIGDYLIDGVKADGEHVHFDGTATDVARRGADGYWRYVIDNPPGTDRDPP